LGAESCRVLGTILKNNYQFTLLDLSENNIGIEGITKLCESFIANRSLISINLSGNNLNAECAATLFDILKTHSTITEINISNNEKLHKNRIGSKGCNNLMKLLQMNEVLTILNIAGNAIGNEGMRFIIEGLQGNKTLLSLNISNNNLPQSCIYSMTPVLLQSRVCELILRHNNLVDRVRVIVINSQWMI
jgi:Ran GTPase-activating protein (RanGAP) involved in mRNA processing and transport